MSEHKRTTDLADPTSALVSYLDDLLYTATSTVTDEPEVQEDLPPPALEAPEVKAVVEAEPEPEAPTPPDPERTQGSTLESIPAPVTAAPEPALPAADKAVSAEAEKTKLAEEPPAPLEPDANPYWADRPFECLIFRVAGLQLAVPLVLLGAIHRIDDRIKPIPGRPPWYMGMLLDRNQKLKVVDSAEWIMTGRVPDGARDGYRFVIRLDDSDWALACDQVAESFTLDPDQVRWRTSRSKRPWLAGTVVKHMCALIDVGAMSQMLARAEREHHLELD